MSRTRKERSRQRPAGPRAQEEGERTMNRVSSRTGGIGRYRNHIAGRWGACVALMLMSLMIRSAVAAPEDEVRSTFDRFVAAQNAHDVKAVESLLIGSPQFLWITRGTAIWGADVAHKRFASLYEGTWRLDPEALERRPIRLDHRRRIQPQRGSCGTRLA
jgi:hypothetical protein